MKPDPLLLISALVYGVSAIALIFAPVEMLSMIGAGAAPAGVWVAQLLGAAIFGLAQLNWMQRYSTMGGIFGRPLLMANVAFTLIGGLASVRMWREEMGKVEFLAASVVLALLALAFTRRIFRERRHAP